MDKNENLKKRVPFTKDDPRINRKGAPKTKLLKDVLTAELQTESNGVDKLTAIINKLTTMAVKGDMNAIKEVLDRYAGKSVQHMEGNITVSPTPVFGTNPLDNEPI